MLRCQNRADAGHRAIPVMKSWTLALKPMNCRFDLAKNGSAPVTLPSCRLTACCEAMYLWGPCERWILKKKHFLPISLVMGAEAHSGYEGRMPPVGALPHARWFITPQRARAMKNWEQAEEYYNYHISHWPYVYRGYHDWQPLLGCFPWACIYDRLTCNDLSSMLWMWTPGTAATGAQTELHSMRQQTFVINTDFI